MRNSLYIMRMLQSKEPATLHNIEILERQVNHVVRMVDDLMDVARLERGKVVLRQKVVDLNHVVASAVENCLQVARQRGHQVGMHFAPQALLAYADEVRIEQIVSNLVTNAAKFSRQPDEIRVETLAQDESAIIAVTDHGIGFDPSLAETLFDPFLQANPTLERSAGGLGLGLTIVRRLAELHGGSVSAKSAGPGKGSRFEVRLPLARAAQPQQREAYRPPTQAKRHRVVVVEDNPDIRETFRLLITMWGHEVFLAEDGPSGVDSVLRLKPDVALIDVGLPEMNGYEVARTIRRTIPARDLRLVAVTGYGQPSDREMAIEAGFDAHLLKPVAPEILEKMLAE
jgi:CheY-like chemotaxis protein